MRNIERRLTAMEQATSDKKGINTFADLIRWIHGVFDGQEVQFHPAITALLEKVHNGKQ
ncbi:MAG: hypothetical protein BWY71_01134 [Planctomycetes bacterium ADurb.Bin412]|nr:MAG: hypothetical protein BWY71_01134 [Planctomycetes bacterium ADurb.Bin412]